MERRAQHILIWVDRLERYRFFGRVSDALAAHGCRVTMVTNKLSITLNGRRGDRKVLLARAADVTGGRPPASLDGLRRSREVSSGELSLEQASRLYRAAAGVAERVDATDPVDQVFQWNGGEVHGQALTRFAIRRGLPRLFFEIANLPGKIFVDPRGVNAASWLFQNPEVLDPLDVSLESFRGWRDGYVANKLRAHKVPQARNAVTLNWHSLLDSLGYGALGIPYDVDRTLFRKAFRKLVSRRRRSGPGGAAPPDRPFFLFPLQVSNDTQILLNSDVGLEEGVAEAARRASEAECELLVKPHPAEPDPAVLERIAESADRLGFTIVGGNTIELIQRARRVITINSTVGLEARLLGTPVDFLGRTHVQHLYDERRLAAYVLGYLVDVDYFAAGPIASDVGAAILERARASKP